MPVTDLAERTRISLYRHLADTGAAPDKEELAARLGVPVDQV